MFSMSHSKFLHTNPTQLKLLYQLSTDWALRMSTWRGERRCLLSIALFPQSVKSYDWLIRNIWTIWRRCLISLVCFCGFAWSKLPSSHDVNEVGWRDDVCDIWINMKDRLFDFEQTASQFGERCCKTLSDRVRTSWYWMYTLSCIKENDRLGSMSLLQRLMIYRNICSALR